MQDSNVNSFIIFLRRIDLFSSVLHIIWALIISLTVFVDYDRLNIELPVCVVIICTFSIIVLELFVKHYFFTDISDKKRISVYLSFNVFIPVIISFILICNIDRFYDYEGVFLGGLGQWAVRMVGFGLYGAALIIYGIICLVRKRRKKLNKTFDKQKLLRIRDVLNLLVVCAIAVGVIIFGTSYAVETFEQYKEEQRLQKLYSFRDEMLGKLPDDSYSALCGEVYMSVWMIQSLYEQATGISLDDVEKENGNGFKLTKVSREVFENGLSSYTEFLKKYNPEKKYIDNTENTSEPHLMYNPEDRTVHIGIGFYAKEIAGGGSGLRSFVLKYDDEWKLIDIYFLKGELSSVDFQ